ncbi:MAG: MBL fold metallo-hydrolase [Candidatus Omnitrophica bacterium]|nr:MBL fold metallo-hydrolase [Candidatus Omnitrophota bacterium]MCM8793374.1 MBL fold metallo-hydrolase [Candidatus Omnitrophota bacterium]
MMEKIHWLGHAGFFIDAPSAEIYIDPYQIRKIYPQADIVLVTHDHFDHLSLEDIKKIAKTDTIIVGPVAIKGRIDYTTQILNPGEKINLKDVVIEGVSAYNLRKSFHPKDNGYLGFVITVEKKRIYHAGDTDFIPEMRNIKADIVLLPVGGTYTMDAQEAAEAANAINPQIAIPMHWGSIVGSRKDAEEFKRLCKNEVRILEKE